MTLKYLLHKEFLQIFRDPFLSKITLVFPIMIMCVMPWVMDMNIKNISVEIVDNDHSTLSSELIGKIDASDYFNLVGMKSSYKEAMIDVEDGDVDLIVEIPSRYSRDLVNGSQPQILIAANAVNGTKGSIGSSYMSGIITQHVSPDLYLMTQKVSTLFLYNKHLNYKLFMIPSLMAILVMMMCGFLPALNIVSEKEKGTIEAVNVTPVNKWLFILAKLIPYWFIGLIVMTICFILSWLVYGIVPAGNIALLYLLAILLAFIFSGFGLIISNYNNTMQQAVFVMWFFVLCLMLLSGLFTPTRSMPDWAYKTTYLNPMAYFIDAIRTVFVKGGDFASISHQVWVLTGFAVAMDLWAVASYRKNS